MTFNFSCNNGVYHAGGTGSNLWSGTRDSDFLGLKSCGIFQQQLYILGQAPYTGISSPKAPLIASFSSYLAARAFLAFRQPGHVVEREFGSTQNA
jgi:hypothetical protein